MFSRALRLEPFLVFHWFIVASYRYKLNYSVHPTSPEQLSLFRNLFIILPCNTSCSPFTVFVAFTVSRRRSLFPFSSTSSFRVHIFQSQSSANLATPATRSSHLVFFPTLLPFSYPPVPVSSRFLNVVIIDRRWIIVRLFYFGMLLYAVLFKHSFLFPCSGRVSVKLI